MKKLATIGISILLIAACAPRRLPPTVRRALRPTPTPTSTSTWTPTPSPTPTPTCAQTTYVVQSGDTLGGIAANYGTTAEAICAFNALPDCSVIQPGQELLIPCEGVMPIIPTASPTPTVTPTPLLTPTPTLAPTPTPTPSHEFMYQEGSMQTAPDCSAVYLRARVVDAGGQPMNDIAVRLQWAGFVPHTKITGRGDPELPLGSEPDGEVAFTPLGSEQYHTPMDFYIRLVQSASDPTPRSDEVIVHFTDCATAGAFTNITFLYQW